MNFFLRLVKMAFGSFFKKIKDGVTNFVQKAKPWVDKIGSAASTAGHWLQENTSGIGKQIGDGLVWAGDKAQDIAKRLPDAKGSDNTIRYAGGGGSDRFLKPQFE